MTWGTSTHDPPLATPLPPFKSLPPVARTSSAVWLHCAMFVLVTSLCLAFSGADTKLNCFSEGEL